MKSKLIRVRDRGTDMVFIVAKFEPEDRELLERTGWELTEKLSLMVAIGNNARAAISTFGHPEYDIIERTGKLGFNKTTSGVAEIIRDCKFEDIPETIDLRYL